MRWFAVPEIASNSNTLPNKGVEQRTG